MILPHCKIRFHTHAQLEPKLFYIWLLDLFACESSLWQATAMEDHLTGKITSHSHRWGGFYNVTRRCFSDESSCSCFYCLFLKAIYCLSWYLPPPAKLPRVSYYHTSDGISCLVHYVHTVYSISQWYWIVSYTLVELNRSPQKLKYYLNLLYYRSTLKFWAFFTILSPIYPRVALNEPKCVCDVQLIHIPKCLTWDDENVISVHLTSVCKDLSSFVISVHIRPGWKL